MDKISVIVPCFNEEEVLPLFYKEVVHTLEKIQNIDYEILFINHFHVILEKKQLCMLV